MKTLLLLFLLLPFAALAVRVPALPFGGGAISEASTNIPFTVDFGRMDRIAFTLALDASPTGGVEVAVGVDADGDGVLGQGEADWTFGYDCGRWFCRDAAGDRQEEAPAPPGGRLRRVFLLRRERMEAAWNLVRVTRRGAAETGEEVAVEGDRPGTFVEIR